MIVGFTRRARAQVQSLLRHYISLERFEAAARFNLAIDRAIVQVGKREGPFLRSPRPYPALATRNWQWLKQDRYWFAFRETQAGAMITGVFYERANIPGRT